MRAILSVSDKTGLDSAARRLVGLGVELYSTGGTLRYLLDAGLPARAISDITGFPEILEGRVKTLHPGVHGGILARRSRPDDLEQIAALGIEPIDVVVVNLYPFAETVSQSGVELGDALEQIDIGGPTLARAAAKSFEDVLVLTDAADYDSVLEEWSRHGAVSSSTRRHLAAKAFAHVASYDSLIAAYLADETQRFPDQMTVSLAKVQQLRYGENPHQLGALYRQTSWEREGLAGRIEQLAGQELSFNNVLDADLALGAVADFLGPTVAIVKHGNPCGLATNEDLVRAFELALMADPVSAYGGVVAVNRPVTRELAEQMAKTFFEVIIAPEFDGASRDLLARKKKLRVLTVGTLQHPWESAASPLALDFKRVSGGFLVQTPDALAPDELTTRVVSQREPTLEEVTDLIHAWRAAKHVRSNAIVLVKELALVGMGAGQPSRVDAVRLAVEKAGPRAEGSVLASDAFFPFADGVEAAAAAGVTAVIQPGGSIRDDEVVEVANRHNIAMLFTGERHFRH